MTGSSSPRNDPDGAGHPDCSRAYCGKAAVVWPEPDSRIGWCSEHAPRGAAQPKTYTIRLDRPASARLALAVQIAAALAGGQRCVNECDLARDAWAILEALEREEDERRGA